MQVRSEPDSAAHFGRILASEVPGGRGLQAWDALLRAHATLLSELVSHSDEYVRPAATLSVFDVTPTSR
jgi:hypothetical protein